MPAGRPERVTPWWAMYHSGNSGPLGQPVPRPGTVGDFVSPVAPRRLEQHGKQVWMAIQEDVIDGRRGDGAREATRLGRPKREQAHHIATVGMIRKPLCGLITARTRF